MELLDNWTKRYEELVWMLVPNPIGQPVTGRFYSRGISRIREELIQKGELELWHIQDNRSDHDDTEDDELDREQLKARKGERKHIEDVYNAYLRHGWLDHFDKEGCKAELLELEKRKDADEMQQMDEANTVTTLFD